MLFHLPLLAASPTPGETLSAVLRRFEGKIRPEVFLPQEGELRWHFLRTATPPALVAA